MKICVDPGHYKGYNHSPVNPDFAEGTRMWVLALFLKAALEAYGAEVVLTKHSDRENPSLKERGEKAKGCDVFISLHANSPAKRPDGTYDESIEGIVVFYPIKHKDVRPFANVIAERVAKVMKTCVFDITSKALDKYPDLDYYGVLRSSVAAGCPYDLIVEHGFYTNPKNCEFLMSDANLEKIAQTEAATIVEWCKLHKKTMYRVQTGAYRVKENAVDMVRDLQNRGFSAFIERESDGMYHVYSGSYENKKNAEDKRLALNSAGFDAFVKEVIIND